MDIPSITLDARDPHAPGILKALAAKHRAMKPEHAALLDKMADGFAAWKRRNPNVK